MSVYTGVHFQWEPSFSLASMATVLLPIRSEPALPAAIPSLFDDADFDPFGFVDDYYEEDPAEAWAAMARQCSKDTIPNKSQSVPQPAQNDIAATLDLQMASGSGASSHIDAGVVPALIAGGGVSPLTPTRPKRSLPSGVPDPTPKRRRINGKTSPPPAVMTMSRTPQSSSTSGSVCSLTDTPVSASSIDDSKDDKDEKLEDFAGPADEWRTQFLMAYNAMRR